MSLHVYGTARVVRVHTFQSPAGDDVRLTVASNREFKNAKGEVLADFPELRRFYPAGAKKGPIPFLEQGDLIEITGDVRTASFKRRDGSDGYDQYLRFNNVTMLEGKAAKADRKARVAANAATAAPAAPAAVEPEAEFC